MPDRVASPAFVQDVQWALRHLYDPAELGKSALLQQLKLNHHEDPLAALHALLVDAINALKPGRGVPPQAHAWRVYHILFNRYAEQFTQRQVATDLALSIRQLRRQEDQAVEVLANYLWTRYNLGTAGSVPVEASPQESTAVTASAPSREEELAWLKRTMPSEASDLHSTLNTVFQTISPLTRALDVHTTCTLPDDLPRVAMPPTTLRQAVVNVLTAVIGRAPHRHVAVTATVEGAAVRLSISAQAEGNPAPGSPQDMSESLEMALRLVELSGGTLAIGPSSSTLAALTVALILPAMQSVEVLLIDDNLDTLRLFEAYMTGTRYHCTATHDPLRALQWIEEKRFQIIVLDVMLPGIDGWDLLGRLREHPATRGVPILVCTIMPQEGLALTLGAAAFLRKPVSRTTLLETLDRLTGASAPVAASSLRSETESAEQTILPLE